MDVVDDDDDDDDKVRESLGLSPTCLMKTVLPDPLGPETTSMFREGVSVQSFGTKDEHAPS